MPQSRILYLDYLRLFATLAVIMLHISCCVLDCSSTKISYTIGLAYDSICRWCVPIFVMISGAIFLNSEKQITVSSLYKKYILRLLVALVFWIAIYYYVFDPTLQAIKNSPIKIINIIDVLKNPFANPIHLWYLPMIIGLYIVLPILKLIVSNTVTTKYFLTLWFAWSLITSIPNSFIFQGISYLKMEMVVGYSGYMILGYKLSQKDIHIKISYLVTTFLLVSFLVFFAAANVSNIENVFQYLNPLVIIMSTIFFCLIKNIIIEYRVGGSRIIELIRNDLFGVYLIHIFFIRLFFRPLFYGQIPVLLSIPLFTIIVFFASLLTSKAIRKIPIIRYICS